MNKSIIRLAETAECGLFVAFLLFLVYTLL